MLNLDVDKAVYETFKVAESKIGNKDTFSTYSPIYLAPTSNVIDTVNLYTKDQEINNALVVGSQGAFAYELILNGAKYIDCFDKNILQYLYFILYNTAIKTIDFEDFIANFTSQKLAQRAQSYEHILSNWLLFDVLDEMVKNVAEYWAKLYKTGKFKDLIASNLFRTYYPFFIEDLKVYSSVYNKENYYKLQKLLNNQDIEINYHICDISELPKTFKDKQYDLMMFDNILQYYKHIPALDNISTVNLYAKEKLTPMLTNNGKIQIGYGFEVVADAVKGLLDIDVPKLSSGINQRIIEYTVKKEQKEGFVPNIIKKYGLNNLYSIDFIKAVEEMNGHLTSQNLVLTYTPPKR